MIARKKLRLWQKIGESYEHVLMKALGYAMFRNDYEQIQIELNLGLRYTPDLIALNQNEDIEFWGECGQISIRKIHWILKHTDTKKLVLFKIGFQAEALIKKLRKEIPKKYRPEGRVLLVNFVSDIVNLSLQKDFEQIPESWFSTYQV
ncbi:MAG: hypothetical protein N2Z23_05670 [Pyrinomonadaceae bacterium]|nr:hypothetical protein [Pyrinomonadaceae bacterium]MCX7639912.1 hypothetical protein [Pyrinomonadaceae bacterium]MDW8304084.1 hypothetical protein [Acidobacteriota bacterium]